MNNYLKTGLKKDCAGCTACALKCPQKAIEMKMDEEGFLYPFINKDKCTQCGSCIKICEDVKVKVDSEVYAAQNSNIDELAQSASGGMFKVIAKYILKNGGVVFGAMFNENLDVIHNYIENEKDLKMLSGSKYVRSDLNNSFVKLKDFLDKGRYVLFSGTPCQCMGVRKFLQKDYERLILCEIICHANPSPLIYRMYINNLELQEKSKVKNIIFRNKENGWHDEFPTILFENGNKRKEKYYIYSFGGELINRPSCNDCRYSSAKRYSDFTIGDYWGIKLTHPEIEDDNTGISVLIVNTDKAKEIFKKINSNMHYYESTLEKAFRYNHNSNVKQHKNRKKLFDGIKNNKINEKNIIKYLKKYTNIPLYKKILIKIKTKVRGM